MNRRSNTTSLITRLFVFVVTLALVGADLIVPAQNANSSTTTQNDNMATQDNTSGTNMTRSTGRRRRRGRRRSSGMNMSNANAACGPMEENTNAGGMQGNANTTEATGNMNMGGRRRGRRRGNMAATTPVRTGRCDPNVQEQTDLSGTYTGTVNYPEGGLSGDATLTINGNDFTLTSGSSTQEGRVVAVTTCNYTAVTMMFGKAQTTAATGTQPAALPAVSLRAKRTGRGISLMSVPGEAKQFSFSSSGGGMGGGRRRRRGRRMEAPPTPPAEATTPSEPTETTAPTTTTGGRRRRGRRRGGNMNANTSGENMNMGTPGENTNMTGEPAGNMNTGGRRRGGRRRAGNTNTSDNMNMNMGNSNANTPTPPQ